jgi:hypothetical protein
MDWHFFIGLWVGMLAGAFCAMLGAYHAFKEYNK